MNYELAVKIFDELYDDDDLKELHEKKIIAQPIGFKISTIAIIECELNAYHDRLTEENAKLREMLEESTEMLENFFANTGSLGANHQANKNNTLLNQLKDQNNEK